MSYAELAQFLNYDEATGLLTWSKSPRNGKPAGSVAGCNRSDGYITIKFRGRRYMGHVVAWLLATGSLPLRYLDHKNLIRDDNRLVNLREATPTQNGANCAARGAHLKGVTFRAGRYSAQVKSGGRNYYLGRFDTQEEANAAYWAKAQELFGEYARAA